MVVLYHFVYCYSIQNTFRNTPYTKIPKLFPIRRFFHYIGVSPATDLMISKCARLIDEDPFHSSALHTFQNTQCGNINFMLVILERLDVTVLIYQKYLFYLPMHFVFSYVTHSQKQRQMIFEYHSGKTSK